MSKVVKKYFVAVRYSEPLHGILEIPGTSAAEAEDTARGMLGDKRDPVVIRVLDANDYLNAEEAKNVAFPPEEQTETAGE